MSKPVQVGRLNKVAKIQRVITTTDDDGFTIEKLETIANVRCFVEFDDRLMRERIKDGGIDSTVVKIFSFRYLEDLTEDDFIIFNNKKFEIYGINNVDEDNRLIKVWARHICK